jgi:hypothetical protein
MRSGYVGAWFAKGRPAARLDHRGVQLALAWQPHDRCYKKDYQSAGSSGGAFRRFLLALIPALEGLPRSRCQSARHLEWRTAWAITSCTPGLTAAVGSAPGQVSPDALAEVVDQVLLLASDEDADALSSGVGLSSAGWRGAPGGGLLQTTRTSPLTTVSRATHGVGRLGIDGAPDKRSFNRQARHLRQLLRCQSQAEEPASGWIRSGTSTIA